jgi:hypothetical protein
MTTIFRIEIKCDEGMSPECLGTFTEASENVREFDFIGTRLYQEGWLRGFRNLGDKEHPNYADFGTFDVCPACHARAEGPIGGDDGGSAADGGRAPDPGGAAQ